MRRPARRNALPPPAPQPPPCMGEPLTQTSSKPRVLLADDDAVLLQLVMRYLENDYEAVAVTSGEAGLEEFDKRAFDVVITDRALGEMPGSVFAGMIKERAPTVPIILITGYHAAEVDAKRYSG